MTTTESLTLLPFLTEGEVSVQNSSKWIVWALLLNGNISFVPDIYIYAGADLGGGVKGVLTPLSLPSPQKRKKNREVSIA